MNNCVKSQIPCILLNSRNQGVLGETAHRVYTEGFNDEYLIVGLLTTLAINLDLRITSPRTQVVEDSVAKLSQTTLSWSL
jgi:hypothetical protein